MKKHKHGKSVLENQPDKNAKGIWKSKSSHRYKRTIQEKLHPKSGTVSSYKRKIMEK